MQLNQVQIKSCPFEKRLSSLCAAQAELLLHSLSVQECKSTHELDSLLPRLYYGINSLATGCFRNYPNLLHRTVYCRIRLQNFSIFCFSCKYDVFLQMSYLIIYHGAVQSAIFLKTTENILSFPLKWLPQLDEHITCHMPYPKENSESKAFLFQEMHMPSQVYMYLPRASLVYYLNL